MYRLYIDHYFLLLYVSTESEPYFTSSENAHNALRDVHPYVWFGFLQGCSLGLVLFNSLMTKIADLCEGPLLGGALCLPYNYEMMLGH